MREGVRFATPAEAENLNVLKMSALDFVALGLASLIVALTMTREVRDLNIGAMMTMQAIERQRDAKKHDEDAEGGRARVAQTTTSQVAADGPTLVRSLDAEASDVGSMVQKGTNKILNELTMPSHLASFGDDDYKIGEDTYTHVWRYLLAQFSSAATSSSPRSHRRSYSWSQDVSACPQSQQSPRLLDRRGFHSLP